MQRHDTGVLIAIEGIDGAGKTTQVARLVDHFKANGVTPIQSKEPTDGSWGRKIRQSAQHGRMSPAEEIEAFTEDRKEHVRNLIGPALESGRVVILDRYFYSTIAYQGAHGGDVRVLDAAMHEIAPEPDIVFLLDVSPEIGLARITRERGDKPNAFESAENLRAVRSEFQKLAQRNGNICVIDGMASADDVHRQIVQRLESQIGPVARLANRTGS
jgi:dTMP kinase